MVPFTVAVPALPPNAAVLPPIHRTAAEPLNQLAVVVSQGPVPPAPLAPKLSVCAPAVVDIVTDSSMAAGSSVYRLLADTTCHRCSSGRVVDPWINIVARFGIVFSCMVLLLTL
jgi:hypothetical protein